MSERDDARRLLRELLPELLHETLGERQRRAPCRRCPRRRWPPCCGRRPGLQPPAAGEVIGDGASAEAGRVEHVTLDSDEDLDRFVRSLLARFESDGAAIRAGRLRFSLGRPGPGRAAARCASSAAR